MSALDRIANAHLPRPAATLNRVITTVNKRVQKQLLYSPSLIDTAPLPQVEVTLILGYLFPDSLNNPRYPYPTSPIFDKSHLKKHVVRSR